MKPLRIALYYPWIYLKGGIERSMAALISRSRHDWTIFTSHYEPENTFEEFKNFKIVKIGDVCVKRDMGSVLKSAMNIVTLRLPLDEYDAYALWCDGIGTLTTFRNSSVPTFNICSTPLRPVYDPVYAREALRSRKPAAKLAYHILKRSFRLVDRMAWSRFDGVIATSLEVKQRILDNKLYPDDGRMILRHPGIDISDAPSKVSYEKFFLVPGRISWTKNVQLAIDAFLKADLPEPWRLVIAGFVDQKSQPHIVELKERAKNDPRVEFVANPDDYALNKLYESAYSVLFTPLNEDWGMTPLEAMLRSKPVIANCSGGPTESVLDRKTGWLLDPDEEQWAQLLREIIEKPELVETMGRAARKNVERYDWSTFVDGIDEQFENVVGNSSTQPISIQHATA